MIFTEPRFIVFFVLVFSLYWSLRENRTRKVVLLAASYVFYAAWDWRFLSLILASTLIDYVAGRAIYRSSSRPARRRWLQLSLIGNLGILGFFKYFDFFVDQGLELLALLGLPVSQPSLEIILPVGISFFTFQTMSYSLDIYRGKLEPTDDLLDLALFVGFFPQLVAGPIVRAARFLPQLVSARRLADVDGRFYLALFLIGFVKKACISDNISPFVDIYFAAPYQFTALSAWIAVLLYAAQIYCDFSGYSDMAIACAGLLGYDIGTNFNFPYFAGSVREFWRRWHISLSTWLRDYLYFSLGGSRGSTLFTYRNLMLTMLLGGLWHGAAWNFVVWGGLHGVALIAQREWRRFRGGRRSGSVLVRSLLVMATFYWVCFAWIFFRAPRLDEALAISRAFLFFQDLGPQQLRPDLLALFALLVILHALARRLRLPDGLGRLPAWSFWPAYGATTAVALALVRPTVEPFIYFQF